MLFVQHLDRQQKATALERQRAAQFKSEAVVATTLYHDELERSEQERIDLASGARGSVLVLGAGVTLTLVGR